MLSIFHAPVDYLPSSEKCLFKLLAHCLIGYFDKSSMSSLDILNINPSVTSFCKCLLFSHSIRCLFVDGFLCYAKTCSLTRFHLFVSLFLLYWEIDPRKHCYTTYVKDCFAYVLRVLWFFFF